MFKWIAGAPGIAVFAAAASLGVSAQRQHTSAGPQGPATA